MSDEPELAAASALENAYPQSAERLKRYVDILASRGISWGLMGPREGERLWQRHVGNSLALDDAVPQGSDVADVGSGAGLPGLPLAIVRPDLRVTLIEPLLRRANFLQEAVDELGLGDRVTVVRARAEDVRERYDVVVCRAVAPLEKLLKWTLPLFGDGGQLLALKGESAEEEIRAAGKPLSVSGARAEVLELRVAAGVEGTRAIRVTTR
ncbi:16S rRNA (guanine(527)-N(7))-methyltransferase [Tessaracoccus lapidicaptus]|uniref:Ribosomal RNA small subunit methyltransferase G n=1 Tax=Tessaracoccus lapidicaptus TaxID=1427523 RepID=A0A1C0ARR7_9ACTN|nr:16S rRNA (guanine(527)-N(7))-methyltransferase RsmG [Tessaracoccus sp. T2.5-30]OCL37108.1 16S rRNA (guanine(527)-N(7))-methyltransferase [Tessaracoccus lapidicaptus]